MSRKERLCPPSNDWQQSIKPRSAPLTAAVSGGHWPRSVSFSGRHDYRDYAGRRAF